MRLFYIYISFCFCLFFTAKVISQNQDVTLLGKSKVKEQQNQVEPPPSVNLEDADKLIHYGDLIDVDIVGSTEYDWRGTITPEGFLDGIEFTEKSIYALCRSEDQIAQAVADSYKKFLNSPQVRVRILDNSNRPLATLYGAVNKEQKYKLKRKAYLNELIIIAGGFTDKTSGEIQILRQNDTSCRARLENEQINQGADSEGGNSQFINIKIADRLSGKEEANPLILYGDVINVFISQPVYVIGGVENPGKISAREELTLARAIATAGGFSRKAVRQKIRIFRKESGVTKIINADFNKIEKAEEEDITLKPYDIIDVSIDGVEGNKYPPIIEEDSINQNNSSGLPLRIID